MAKRERKNARLQTNFKAETQAVTDVEQAGNKTIPEGGEAVPADAGVPAGEQAGPVQNDPSEPPAEGTGDDPAADTVAAVEEPALDVGTEAAENDPAGWRVDTARAAAVNAYLGAGFHIGVFDQAVEWDPHAEHFVAATTFVQAERNSPAEAIPIQLALKKLGGSMSPQPQEVMLWSVFRDVFLRVFDHLKAIDDAEAAKAAGPEPAGGLPLDRALEPQPGPFDPQSGFSPRV